MNYLEFERINDAVCDLLALQHKLRIPNNVAKCCIVENSNFYEQLHKLLDEFKEAGVGKEEIFVYENFYLVFLDLVSTITMVSIGLKQVEPGLNSSLEKLKKTIEKVDNEDDIVESILKTGFDLIESQQYCG